MVLSLNRAATRQPLQCSRYELATTGGLLTFLSRNNAGPRWPACIPRPRGRDYANKPAASTEIRRKPRWTPEEDQKLSRLVHDGYPLPVITKRFPTRTYAAVRLRWERTLSGMPNDSPTPLPPRRSGFYTREDDEKLLQLKRDGKTLPTIAKDLGRSLASVTDRLSWRLIPGISQANEQRRAAGTTARGWKWPEPILERELATVVYLRKQGAKWVDIAHVFPKRPLPSLQAAYYNRGLVQWGGLVSDDPRSWSDRKLRALSGQESSKALAQSSRAGGLVRAHRGAARPKASSAGFCTLSLSRMSQTLASRLLRNPGVAVDAYTQIRAASTVPAGAPYSEEEDKTVRRLREEGHQWRDIARSVGRSLRSVNSRYHNESGYVRITPPSVPRGVYSDEEDRLVLQLRRSGHTFVNIAKQLQGRSVDSVTKHYHNSISVEIGRRRSRKKPQLLRQAKRWTAEEIGTVVHLRNVKRGSFPAIAKQLPGRTMSSVSKAYQALCKRSGTPPVRLSSYWTAEEDATLMREKAAGKTLGEIAKLLPNRTVTGVDSRWHKALSLRASGSG